MDVELHLGTKVNNVSEKGVQFENQFLPARTVIWAAANSPSSLARELDAETDRQGGRFVDPRPLNPIGKPPAYRERLACSRVSTWSFGSRSETSVSSSVKA